MHPDLARLLGQWHTEQLMDEARRERLARPQADARAGREIANAPAWRRWIGWAFIDLGVRVAGGSVNPAEQS